jgi:hypothetical protein
MSEETTPTTADPYNVPGLEKVPVHGGHYATCMRTAPGCPNCNCAEIGLRAIVARLERENEKLTGKRCMYCGDERASHPSDGGCQECRCPRFAERTTTSLERELGAARAALGLWSSRARLAKPGALWRSTMTEAEFEKARAARAPQEPGDAG